MQHYYELAHKAEIKNIHTFRDILTAIFGSATAGDAYDMFGTEEAEEMLDEAIYNCDAAIIGLDSLAQEGII